MSKIKKITYENVFNNRSKLEDFYNEYNRIDSVGNTFKRMKNNKRKKFFYWFLVFLFVDVLAYLIGLNFILTSTGFVVSIWTILIIVTIVSLIKNNKNFEDYRREVNKLRDIEVCELLKRYKINTKNIENVINYFTLEIEPENKIYEKSTFLKSIIEIGSNLFYLILGIIIPNIISEKLQIDKVQTYALIFAILILIVISICFVKVIIYFNSKNKYIDRVNKLIIELKMIKILNKL